MADGRQIDPRPTMPTVSMPHGRLTFGQVPSIGSTPVQIVPAVEPGERQGVLLRVVGSNDSYLGNSTVTASSGMLFKATDQPWIDLKSVSAYYAVSVSGVTVIAYVIIE